MLKSLSTQFAATLFFGPLGLAYSSVAAAVFLTLVLAVLVFTEIGILAVALIWPISIVVGLIFVKLHNDGMRSSGSRLLLGPGEEPGLVSALGSWGRGLAALALIFTAGYLVYLYLPSDLQGGNSLGRIVDADGSSKSALSSNTIVSDNPDSAETAVIAANSKSNDNFAVIALPQREVATVVLDSNGSVVSGEVQQPGIVNGQSQLTVRSSVVNIRQGPGTNFPIVTQVEQGDKLIEFARDGQWINVETEASGYTGWIFNTLVQ